MDLNQLVTTVGLLGIWLILFAESGLLFGFFLPGDSLLLTAGILAAGGNYFGIIPLLIVCISAAILGDSAGYAIGATTGKKIKNNKNSFIVKMGYLNEAEKFYNKHGGKTIVFARFVPAVRSFVPMVAGMSNMHYLSFIKFNVIGGILWGGGVTLIGYYFGKIDWVRRYFELIIIGIILASLIPGLWHVASTREKRARLKTNILAAKKSLKEHRMNKKATKNKK
ncbi:MAG: VTT domain-containing protein [Candidatus Nomurabacteria bacterium]|nr:MAG: VTT domain-containing protein [Candidatus Nomurabacteria bacterium]